MIHQKLRLISGQINKMLNYFSHSFNKIAIRIEASFHFADISLGFAAGIMTAASFWSLLAPAIELAESDMGSFAFSSGRNRFRRGFRFRICC